MIHRIATIATLIYGAVLPAWAVDIPIVNAGFEQVVLPCAPGPTCIASSNVAGWTGTGAFGTFRSSTGPGGIYSSGVPEGVNVAALGDGNSASSAGNGILSQVLTTTLQPNTTYTLNFSVGSRADVVFAGYRVELLAGSTTLASDSSLSPSSGTFVNGRIVYSSNDNPALFGQSLVIRLTGNARGQANFDRMSLDASPTAVSTSASQIASGGGWKTTLMIVNLSPAQNSIRATLRGDDGRPLTLPLVITQQGSSQAVTVSSVERTVEPGAMLLVESEAPVSSPTLVGWAEMMSSGSVAGFAIFRQRSPEGRDAEGTAPLESSRASSLVLPLITQLGFRPGWPSSIQRPRR